MKEISWFCPVTAVATEFIGSGQFGEVYKYIFPRTTPEFPEGVTYSPIIIKFIQMDKLPWELQKETISGIRTALNLAECDLVRFRVWITKVNTGKTDERPIKPVLDAMPAGIFASNLTDESLMIVAMAPVDGDGIDFLKSGLYQTEEKISQLMINIFKPIYSFLCSD